MRFFTKQELTALIIIFVLLVSVSWPNFSLSLRRARDQIRRDDLGNIQAAIGSYYADYGIYPLSSDDGRIIACGTKVSGQATTGNITVNLLPCNWGKESWLNLTPGVDKIYLKTLPGDPSYSGGVSYVYFSDGSRYQLFGSLEGLDEPGYDAKLAARNVACGSRTCNFGRAINVPMYMTIEEYNMQIYCGQHPNDKKCLK